MDNAMAYNDEHGLVRRILGADVSKLAFEEPKKATFDKSVVQHPHSPMHTGEQPVRMDQATIFQVPKICKVEIIKIEVLRQGSEYQWPRGFIIPGLSWSRIAAHEHFNSEYHALKNVSEMMKHLKNQKYSISNFTDFGIYLDFLKTYTPTIFNVRKNFKTFEIENLHWLNYDEMALLVEQMNSEHPILIIENIPSVGLSENAFIAMKKFIESMQSTIGIVYVERKFGMHPHWVGFVANKILESNGCFKVNLYVMNSIPGIATNYSDFIAKLLLLSPEEIDLKIMQSKV
jgi:hypothetical protein